MAVFWYSISQVTWVQVAVFVSLVLTSTSLAQDKLPLPAAQAQQDALALVKEVYGQEWEEAKTSAQRQALATQLLQKATETPEATDRYVLLDVARQIAVQAGDAELAFKTIEAMAAKYDVDAYRLKGSTLSGAAKSATTEQSVAVAKLSLVLVDEAVERDDFVAAKFLGGLATDAARKGRDSTLVKDVLERSRAVEGVAGAFAGIQDALATLKTDPVDPESNLAVGKYHCFIKGNWERGLPMLALGSNEKLQELAVQELKGVSDTAEQVALGDTWWDLAAASEGVAQKHIQGRAALWYEKALPGLSGLAKAKVGKRLEVTPQLSNVQPEDLSGAVSPPSLSTAAIQRGLAWLTKQQASDGRWSFAAGPNPGSLTQCYRAATGMALLPLLRAGNTHQEGEHRDAVQKGLAYLVRNIMVDKMGGSFAEPGASMYGHGICTMAICEAYARTKDRQFRNPCQSAMNYIIYAQDPAGGGWRYKPRQAGDTSVVGWQVAALAIAADAGLKPPTQTLTKANSFLDGVQSRNGAHYGYTGPGAGKSTTAIGLLCRVYFGWKTNNPAFQEGIRMVNGEGTASGDLYFSYYATQLMRHAPHDMWDKWQTAMRAYLIDTQSDDGSWYSDTDRHGAEKGGSLYYTSLALMTLQFCD